MLPLLAVHDPFRMLRQYAGSPDSGLRVDNRISPDDRSAAPNLPADIQTPKENEDGSRQVSLHLHRAEQAGRVMHRLPGSDKDVLPHIRAVPWGLAECASGEQKRQNEATQSVCAHCPPPKTKFAEPNC